MFTGVLVSPHIDDKGYKKELDTEMQLLLRDAAKEFVRATLTKIPVQTGMAASTLKPLGRHLGMLLKVSANRPPRKVKNPSAKNYNKSAARGEAFQRFEFFETHFRYTFVFSTTLYHYYLNELLSIQNVASSPWGSLKVGSEAFFTYVNDNYKKYIPSLKPFISTRKIRIK
ncbi:MAG: hypothetical protein DRN30_05230 [Thermoplasmata archaeon]|nr:MAG: hypothetical protein DRN30_05230 [Thermoplasmata archaeon]